MAQAQIVPFAGFEKNLRLQSGDAALVATLEVGPRILSFGRADGPNLLNVSEKDSGLKEDGVYRSYGGHRLWVAPEDKVTTYAPEDTAPAYREENGMHVFSREANAYGIAKQIAIRPIGNGGFAIRHTVTNAGETTQSLAPWAITVMTTGGECVIPQAKPIPHTERLLPVRPIVLWGYARMTDARYTWGDAVIRLRQDANEGPTKIGSFVDQGIATYALGGDVFVKRFGAVDHASYPDFGCNFETFTREDMLEVESLGPMVSLAPGASTVLDETWWLLSGESAPSDDAACGEWIAEIASRCPHTAI